MFLQLFVLFQMIEDNEISDEKKKLKQNIEGIYIHLVVGYLLQHNKHLLHSTC